MNHGHPLLRSLLAIASGFALIAALVAGATAILRKAAPASWSRTDAVPPRSALLVNIACGTLLAMPGGALTAFLSPDRALAHALMLGIAVLVLSGMAAYELPRIFPWSYRLALVSLPPMATLAGGIFVVLRQ